MDKKEIQKIDLNTLPQEEGPSLYERCEEAAKSCKNVKEFIIECPQLSKEAYINSWYDRWFTYQEQELSKDDCLEIMNIISFKHPYIEDLQCTFKSSWNL